MNINLGGTGMYNLICKAKGGDDFAFADLVRLPEIRKLINIIVSVMKNKNPRVGNDEIENIVLENIWYNLKNEYEPNPAKKEPMAFINYTRKYLERRTGDKMITISNKSKRQRERELEAKRKTITYLDNYYFIEDEALQDVLTWKEYQFYKLYFIQGYTFKECSQFLEISERQLKRWKKLLPEKLKLVFFE